MLACLALLGVLQGCRYDSVQEISDGKLNCNLDSITFSGTILPILELNCSNPLNGNCHEQGSSFGDYTAYEGFRPKVDNGGVTARVILNRDMPPDFTDGPKGLPYCDMRALEEWIKAGAPNN